MPLEGNNIDEALLNSSPRIKASKVAVANSLQAASTPPREDV